MGQVTVVIPTHNRARQISALLASIQQNWSPQIDSIVIVDDSENPSDLNGKFPQLKINHVVLKERVFISKAKNLGWKKATTEFVFFIDDDNVVDRDTITGTLMAIRERADAAAVMPAVLYKACPDLVWVYATPFSNPPKFNLLGRNLLRNPVLEGRYYSTDALPNASIVRKIALEQVGGFNEHLVINSSMELAQKMKKRGWKVYAYAGSFIYHDAEPPGKMGWWAQHGTADPERVRFEIRDWFIIRRITRPKEKLLTWRSIVESLRFVVPNSLVYVLRGRKRVQALRAVVTGYAEGIVESRKKLPPGV